MTLKLGVFGGTFDPPHLGHLALAEEARDQLHLDCVLWVIAGQSPLKQDRPLSPPETRAAMVQAAILGNPGFALSRVDLDRPGPHYTVETVRLLRRAFPQAEFFFLMGEDSLRDLPRWRDPAGLIEMAWLAVSQRPGIDTALGELEARVPGLSARVCWIRARQLDIASSDIQRRIQEGRTVRYLVPDSVLGILEREVLYRK
jgi:nicotinate-nucleotide adenylyltransferase